MGISLITPETFITDLWPDLIATCGSLNMQIVSYENNPENAREILSNLGKDIDIVVGNYSEKTKNYPGCSTTYLYYVPLRLAVSKRNPLSQKDSLTWADLDGHTVWLNSTSWIDDITQIKEEILDNHPKVKIEEFPFFDVQIFNKIVGSNDVLVGVDAWEFIHPLVTMKPMEWKYISPMCIYHNEQPSETVQYVLDKAV